MDSVMKVASKGRKLVTAMDRQAALIVISRVVSSMRKTAFTLALAVAVAGCATPAYVSPVEVTRFVSETSAYLGQGTIEIVAAPGLDSNSLEFAPYIAAVRQELEQVGYRVVPQNGGQVAQIGLEQYVATSEGRRGGGVGVGGGASTGTYGSGIGVGVGIDLTRLLAGAPAQRIERQVSVAISRPGGGLNLWEGRAAMVASDNSDYASDAAAAARIADALFRDFPGTSGETIAVE